ncbi:hypothetical protein PG985_014031 [Apiospora marii]|uniref:Rhodopsin domain-containing protein n=1 Tax=Apiospora marii TaxID=335849 RepID=A0ABR1R682_9PEZI
MELSDDVAGDPRLPLATASESRAPVALDVNIGLMVLATAFILLRFYTRYVVLNRLGYDDWLALVAFMFVLATGVTQCWMTEHGLGRHVDTLQQPEELETYTQHLWFSILWYNTAITSTKLALLAQYYRVLPIRSVRRACVTLMVVIGIWGLCQVMLSIFTCFPIQAYWDKSLSLAYPGKDADLTATRVRCISALPLAYQNAAGNIATYVAVLVLPLPALGNLRLPRAQKYLLIAIFCLGFLTCAVAAIRIKYFREYTDPTWEHVDPSILSLTELCSGSICLCLPTLRPLVARWLPASLTSTAASLASNAKGGNRSTTNRSPTDNNKNNSSPDDDPEKAVSDPRRPPPCARSRGRGGGRRIGTSYYYNSSTTATSASSSRRPSASLPRSSASGSDSDFIYGLETARNAVPMPVPTTSPTPSPPPMCMSIMRPLTLGGRGGGGGSSSGSRRSSTAETSSVVRFAAMPAPFSSSASSQAAPHQQQGGNYYVHRNNNQGSYFRGDSNGNWLLESRVSTEIGVSNSPVPSEERRTLGSAAIRVKRMVTRRESMVAGW